MSVVKYEENHPISKFCEGEKCRICGKPATHKVGEKIFPDEELPRHPYTAYVCCEHFVMIFGEWTHDTSFVFPNILFMDESQFKNIDSDGTCHQCLGDMLVLKKKKPIYCDTHHCYRGDEYTYECTNCKTIYIYQEIFLNC